MDFVIVTLLFFVGCGAVILAADKLARVIIENLWPYARAEVVAWVVVEGYPLACYIREFLAGVAHYRATTGRWPTRFTMKCWWAGVTNPLWMSTLSIEQAIAKRR